MREVHRCAFRVRHDRGHRTQAEVPHVRVHRGYGRDHRRLAEVLHKRVHRGYGRDHRRLGDALHVLRVRALRGHAYVRGIPLVGEGCGRN